MPIIVSVQSKDKRTVLKLESGYRCGELLEINGCTCYWQSPEAAIEWAKETGYTVFTAYDETIEHNHNDQYEKIMQRIKCKN